MLVGHFAPGFALRRWAPRIPLAVFLFATQIVDVAWAALVLGGVERVVIVRGFTASNDMDLVYVPYTHSLIATVLWIAGAVALTRLVWPAAGARGALLVGLAVASHWMLDLAVHVADLPLIGDRFKVGFGLWRYRELALAIELAALGAGVAMWARGQPRPAAAWAFFGVLALVQVVTVYRPTPGTPAALATGLLGFYLVVTAVSAAVAHRVERPAPVAAAPG